MTAVGRATAAFAAGSGRDAGRTAFAMRHVLKGICHAASGCGDLGPFEDAAVDGLEAA